jgi:hypothetical protein
MSLEDILRSVARDGALAVLLAIHMIYIGRKLDRLAEVILKGKEGDDR